MTNERVHCPCGHLEDGDKHACPITHARLRGNLSLAEEGLANYALEVERLKQQVVDLRSDYLRRHKDAIDRFETLVKIRDHCEEIRGGAPPHVWIPSLINEVIGHEEHAHEPNSGASFPEGK